MKLGKLIIASSIALSLLSATQAQADSAKDFETLSKAVGFMNNGPSGAVEMAVVFDPSNPASVAHADEVIGLVSAGVGSGKVKLTGKKVEASAVSGSTSKVIFLTKGANAAYGAAVTQAKANGGLTASTDLACLDAAACVVVVKTDPSVDIFVSTKASADTGAGFASAFSMMITQK